MCKEYQVESVSMQHPVHTSRNEYTWYEVLVLVSGACYEVCTWYGIPVPGTCTWQVSIDIRGTSSTVETRPPERSETSAYDTHVPGMYQVYTLGTLPLAGCNITPQRCFASSNSEQNRAARSRDTIPLCVGRGMSPPWHSERFNTAVNVSQNGCKTRNRSRHSVAIEQAGSLINHGRTTHDICYKHEHATDAIEHSRTSRVFKGHSWHVLLTKSWCIGSNLSPQQKRRSKPVQHQYNTSIRQQRRNSSNSTAATATAAAARQNTYQYLVPHSKEKEKKKCVRESRTYRESRTEYLVLMYQVPRISYTHCAYILLLPVLVGLELVEKPEMFKHEYLLDHGVPELAEVVDSCAGDALLYDTLQRQVGDLGGLLVLRRHVRVREVFHGNRFLLLLSLYLLFLLLQPTNHQTDQKSGDARHPPFRSKQWREGGTEGRREGGTEGGGRVRCVCEGDQQDPEVRGHRT